MKLTAVKREKRVEKVEHITRHTPHMCITCICSLCTLVPEMIKKIHFFIFLNFFILKLLVQKLFLKSIHVLLCGNAVRID